MENIYLSVIIPAYKEAGRIGVTLESLEDYFKDKAYAYEIIVVNDGSPDTTAHVVKSYMSRVKNLQLVDNKKNNGKGRITTFRRFQTNVEIREQHWIALRVESPV